ncbi:MAG: lipoyl synthase [Myxococcales bacterium]|nr:lipoyl synthase [Myxococcales bacterium]
MSDSPPSGPPAPRPAVELPVLPAHPEGDRFGRDREALRLPPFLRRQVGKGEAVRGVRQLMRRTGLNTVCEEARCPNLAECFENRTATFLIMGRDCTRACGFCAVGTAIPRPLDPGEPARVAQATEELGLDHVVITSVNRDELPDGGSAHFRATVDAVRARLPAITIEVLTPDFCGDLEAVRRVADGPLQVFNHNVETVPSLYARVRPRARYRWSLDVLAEVARRRPDVVVKSGLMVGLGETPAEVFALLADLRAAGVQIVTIGQYLRPSLRHVPVVEWLTEEAYAVYRDHGAALGFDHVFAGPFVRSSYSAAEALRHARGA